MVDVGEYQFKGVAQPLPVAVLRLRRLVSASYSPSGDTTTGAAERGSTSVAASGAASGAAALNRKAVQVCPGVGLVDSVVVHLPQYANRQAR